MHTLDACRILCIKEAGVRAFHSPSLTVSHRVWGRLMKEAIWSRNERAYGFPSINRLVYVEELTASDMLVITEVVHPEV